MAILDQFDLSIEDHERVYRDSMALDVSFSATDSWLSLRRAFGDTQTVELVNAELNRRARMEADP